MKCVITGCALINDEGLWVVGDLFDAGEVYVFNGKYNANTCSPDWTGEPVRHQRQLTPTAYWERRAVFVVPKHRANLNIAAMAYIGRAQ